MLIDVNSGQIIRHSNQKSPSETLDEILTKEKSRNRDVDKKLDEVFGQMKKRKDELDQAFDEAKKKAAEDPDEPKKDPFRWD